MIEHYINGELQNDSNVDASQIAGFIIRRSPTDNLKFNVLAVDNKLQWLYTATAEVDLDTAIKDQEQLTQDLVIGFN